MPSTITHSYIGCNTINLLNDKPKNILTKNINNYKIYCQSTDVLYFYHIFLLKSNNIQKLGHTFHNKNVYKSFKYLIDYNKENKDEEIFTLICGLLSHYKADSIMHPFINYLSQSEDKLLHADKHFEIESYLDSYFVKINEHNNYQKNKNYQLVFNYEKKDIIENLLNNLFKDIYNEDNIGTKYYKSLKEMKFTYKHVRHDPLGIKKQLFKLIDLNTLKVRRSKYLSYHFPLDNDEYYLNLNHQEWYNIKKKDLVSTESFIDLYNKVLHETANIINKVYSYIYENKDIDLEKLIGNNSYSSGLPLK